MNAMTKNELIEEIKDTGFKVRGSMPRITNDIRQYGDSITVVGKKSEVNKIYKAMVKSVEKKGKKTSEDTIELPGITVSLEQPHLIDGYTDVFHWIGAITVE